MELLDADLKIGDAWKWQHFQKDFFYFFYRLVVPEKMVISFYSARKGDHHIFWMDGIEEILNLQLKGTKAKPYQVGQVRNVILKYKLNMDDKS